MTQAPECCHPQWRVNMKNNLPSSQFVSTCRQNCLSTESNSSAGAWLHATCAMSILCVDTVN